MACTLPYSQEMHGSMSTGVLFPPPLVSLSDLCEPVPDSDYNRFPAWIALEYPINSAKSTNQATRVTQVEWELEYVPRTAFGRKLVELRNKALAAGMRLFSEEEVLEEVKRRRGELEDNEADLY
jgi:hypothetical protein